MLHASVNARPATVRACDAMRIWLSRLTAHWQRQLLRLLVYLLFVGFVPFCRRTKLALWKRRFSEMIACDDNQLVVARQGAEDFRLPDTAGCHFNRWLMMVM